MQPFLSRLLLNRAPVPNFSADSAYAQALSLMRLHLHRFARLRRRANSDNEIPLRRRAGALRNLTDGADGVDDGGACRIRHEPSERFQSPSASWIIGEREHEWLPRVSGSLASAGSTKKTTGISTF